LPYLRRLAADSAKSQEETGGAGRFLEFLAKEVFPFVESNYRISPTDRGLGGYSYGGLFSLYVLLKEPELFSKYFAGSPGIEFGDRVLFDYEKEYASSHKDLRAHLFMSTGEEEGPEGISDMKKMSDVLNSRKYPGLKVESCVFPNENHISGAPASIMRGITALYLPPARKEIKLSPQVLSRYVGVYEIGPGMDMAIILEGSQLFSTVTGSLKLPLFAETETRFFFKYLDAQCEFIKNANGVVTHAILFPANLKATKK
jgi:hypothetical protein